MSEISTRLNGISTPFFGVSWTAATSDVEVARGVLVYLQGHRLLYDSHQITDNAPQALARIETAVREIRSFLSDVLVQGGTGGELSSALQIMRFACMNFLAAIDRYRDWTATHAADVVHFDDLRAHELVLEDETANAVLFRHTLGKVMSDIGRAFDIAVPDMR